MIFNKFYFYNIFRWTSALKLAYQSVFRVVSLGVCSTNSLQINRRAYLLWQVPLMAKHLDSTNNHIRCGQPWCRVAQRHHHIFLKYNFYNKISILAAVSLDVESYSAFINFFRKCKFYTNISILAAVSRDDERAAPSSIFSDEIELSSSPEVKQQRKKNMSIVYAKVSVNPLCTLHYAQISVWKTKTSMKFNYDSLMKDH